MHKMYGDLMFGTSRWHSKVGTAKHFNEKKSIIQ